jgi:hypothetical protein
LIGPLLDSEAEFCLIFRNRNIKNEPFLFSSGYVKVYFNLLCHRILSREKVFAISNLSTIKRNVGDAAVQMQLPLFLS